jgi:hypothetical protein
MLWDGCRGCWCTAVATCEGFLDSPSRVSVCKAERLSLFFKAFLKSTLQSESVVVVRSRVLRIMTLGRVYENILNGGGKNAERTLV